MRSWRKAAPSRATRRASAMPFQAEMPTSPRNARSSARTAAVARSSPGASSTVASAMPPAAAAAAAELLRQRRRRAGRRRRRRAGRRGAAASGRRKDLGSWPRPWRRGRTPPPPPSAARRRRRDRSRCGGKAARGRTGWSPAAARRAGRRRARRAARPFRRRGRSSGRSSPPPPCRRSGRAPAPTRQSRCEKRSPPVMPPPVLTMHGFQRVAGAYWESARAASPPRARARGG